MPSDSAASFSERPRTAGNVEPENSKPADLTVTNLPPIARAGVELAKLVLYFIAAAGVLLLILIRAEVFAGDRMNHPATSMLVEKLAATPLNLTDATQNDAYLKAVAATRDLITAAETARQNTRDFLIKICQLILVSILLPILTALLGYIFGTQQSSTGGGNA